MRQTSRAIPESAAHPASSTSITAAARIIVGVAHRRWMSGSASSSFCASLVRRFAIVGGASASRSRSASR
eukprot:scaffold230729_cov26-Tisochrysis_lutea.AAC.7